MIRFRSSVFIKTENGFVLYRRQKAFLDKVTEIAVLKSILSKMVAQESYEFCCIVRDRIDQLHKT